MPKHELFCSKCGEGMRFECSTADEAKTLLDNEYVRAIRYARLKEMFLIQAAAITHQTIEQYKTQHNESFSESDLLAIYTCLITMPDGACRAKMRNYASSSHNSIGYFIYHTNLKLFDTMMTERGFNDLAQNEEQQGAAQAAAYSRENKRRAVSTGGSD